MGKKPQSNLRFECTHPHISLSLSAKPLAAHKRPPAHITNSFLAFTVVKKLLRMSSWAKFLKSLFYEAA